MKNPKTLDEYIDLVHQAVYEVDELRAIVEDDEERKTMILPWVDAMDKELRQMFVFFFKQKTAYEMIW